MSRSPHAAIPLLLLCFLSTALAQTPSSTPPPPAPAPTEAPDDARYRSTLLFSNVLELVRDEYVDPSAVDYQKLTHAALNGMLSSLDPFSEFLDAERFTALKRDTEGEFTGIGIHLGIRPNQTLTVDMPVEGSPAARAGLLPGDWIVKINGTSTKGLTLNQAVRALRGRAGDPVTLTVHRPTTQQTLDITVIREKIDIPTIRGTRIMAEYTRGPFRPGYLRIVQFAEKTPAQFDQAMRKLLNEGMTGLVLDLRNNPGGLLDTSVDIAGRFVPAGTVIVSTEGRRPSDRAFHESRGREHHSSLPLVILVNRHSASAAEIVAGALKDLGRAVLVGETTYGKGSVQTVQSIDPAQYPAIGVRLTTAKYYTPAHLPIHGVGIKPHIPVHISLDEENAILRRQNWHQLDPTEQEEVQKFPDHQLIRATHALQALHLQAIRRASPPPSPAQ